MVLAGVFLFMKQSLLRNKASTHAAEQATFFKRPCGCIRLSDTLVFLIFIFKWFS
jgi:hypothetical protein